MHHYPITIHNQSQIKIFSIINQKKNMSYPSIVRGVIYYLPTLQPALWILTQRGRGTRSSWRFIQVLIGQHGFFTIHLHPSWICVPGACCRSCGWLSLLLFLRRSPAKKKLKQGTNTYKTCHFAILYKFTIIFSIHPRQPSQHIRPSKATTHIYIYTLHVSMASIDPSVASM